MTKLQEAYPLKPGLPLQVDRGFYGRLANNTENRKLVDKFIVPPRSGKAWPVHAGQLCRIVVVEGPQVADLNIWNLHDPRERFWAARTRQFYRAYVTTYDRLWSCLPYLRPMLTITNDSINYGVDKDGAWCHDLLGTRCDSYVQKLLTGEDVDYTCHSNLARAIAPFNLTEENVHDVLNIFEVDGLTEDKRYASKPSPAREGDFFEFFAEIDLLCAISTCQLGDMSSTSWNTTGGDSAPTCHPLGIEVYQPSDELIEGWESPPPSRACLR